VDLAECFRKGLIKIEYVSITNSIPKNKRFKYMVLLPYYYGKKKNVINNSPELKDSV